MRKNCLLCNNIFETCPARIKAGRGKYCSVPCYRKSDAQKGNANIGRSRLEEVRMKMSEARKGKKNPEHSLRMRCFGNPNWKEGRRVDRNGYIKISVRGKSYLEHRFVMERKLGRFLLPFEKVHHINGNRSDNRPENLVNILGQDEHIKKYHGVK